MTRIKTRFMPLEGTARRSDALIVALAVLIVTGYALTAAAIIADRGAPDVPGFPLDDSWIYQTYARNLAQTGQWAFVPGIPSAASTGPLYTALLAVGYALGVPYAIWTHGLGAAALALCGLVGVRMATRLFPGVPHVGLLTGLALVTTWHLAWAAASGMETMLFSALTLVVIDLALCQIDSTADTRGRWLGGMAFGVTGALLIATRPEGVLLCGLAGLAMLIARPQPDNRLFLAWMGGALLGGLIGIMPYALLNLSLSGSLLPNTFDAKQAKVVPLLTQGFLTNLLHMVEPLAAGPQLLLVPGVALAVPRLARSRRSEGVLRLMPLVWSAALIVLYTLRLPAPYQHGRYVIPALPAFIVIGVGGAIWLVGLYPHAAAWRVILRSITLTAVILFPVFLVIGAQVFGIDVWRINSDMVVAARWVDAHVPTDQLLAVHDIGAVGYFASSPERPRPILDIAGLVSPEVIPLFFNPEGMRDLMRARGVRYLMVMPPQWDDLWLGDAERWGAQFCERFNAGGGMFGMTIYEYREAGCP
jgi:hypothetical protein